MAKLYNMLNNVLNIVQLTVDLTIELYLRYGSFFFNTEANILAEHR